MSKKMQAQITCPNCANKENFTLYRTIWGEYPENRELVMSDKINVFICPSCKVATKLPFQLFYTNTKQHFAVWWEPIYDSQIDFDSKGYAKIFGQGNYLASAPRIKDWNEFKQTIIKFEKGELLGKIGTPNKEINNLMKGFTEHLKKQNNPQKGCLNMFVLLVIFIGTTLYGILKLII